ncbi:hypothetical protein F0P96_03875 [Hymenobacter busanensis]|uniref:Uncharacterized protein n=1 Tax=Hymenobacter busanensis TaxID=2607656 RepID=A0A7L4ZTM4_9BACT|nr:hypothetical protein [Hymenobacter busanensis]KAA9339764.1 hypothetical protein F0P96_03875 [Hymenobacter busanensis]QHJ06481.1 hypothetical protein GUY19_03870 [Hymenobacter busanensis]
MTTTDTTLPSASAGIRQKALIAGLNATVLYVLAYLLTTTAYQLATIRMARRLSIPLTWHLERVEFRITNPEWWRVAVLAVYSVGPLVCFLLGTAALLVFWYRARQQRGLLKQFLLWLALHCCNMFFGAMVADTFTQSGFWYIPSWLFLAGNVPNVIVAVVFGLIQVALGYFAAVLFLQSHDSISLMKYRNRAVLLVSTLLAPWVLGSVIVALLKWPALTLNEELHFATMVLLIGPLALAAANQLFEFTLPVPQKTRIAWELVGLLAAVLLLFRVVLGHGISLG